MTPQEQPDSQAGDEIDQLVFEFAIGREKTVPPHIRTMLINSQPTVKKLKVAIEAYGERLATKRAVATVMVILNTCKYEGRELFLSTGAVESLLKDLQANDDSHKALTAIHKQVAIITKETEDDR